MNLISKILISLIYNIITILIGVFILTSMYYYNIINQNTYKILKILLLLISIIIFSNNNKVFIKHLLYGIVIIISMLIYTFINYKLSIKHLLYYSLILASSIIGLIFKQTKKSS